MTSMLRKACSKSGCCRGAYSPAQPRHGMRMITTSCLSPLTANNPPLLQPAPRLMMMMSGRRRGDVPQKRTLKTVIEPFRIKVVEPIVMTTREQRETIVQNAHFNLFFVHSDNVLIDLLTDSGTGAMSSDQWAGIMRGDESYAGSPSFFHFEQRIQEMTGFKHVLPTHQGRASERILFELVLGNNNNGQNNDTINKSPDDHQYVIPNNAHFDTTRANIEHHMGSQAVDLPIEEASDPKSRYPFKGNMDTTKLEELLLSNNNNSKQQHEEKKTKKIPLVMCTITNNSCGGQPVSLENLRSVRQVCNRYNVPLFLDACRFAENAYFIQQREPGQAHRSITDIVREMFDLADGATISAKKDGLVNIGGVLLMRDEQLFRRASELLILTEGYLTYGGLAGRDLEAMAQGFEEVVHQDYLSYRIQVAKYVGDKLMDNGIQIIEPPGGHAIYVDAGSFCPHIPKENFPGQALVVGLYRLAGIRSCEIGSVMFGGGRQDKKATTSTSMSPANNKLELVRLAFPRRVYTQSHMDYVIEALVELYSCRFDELRGLRIKEGSESSLRHFTAKFEEVE